MTDEDKKVEDIKTPPSEDKEQGKAPAPADDAKKPNQDTLPEKFKGKSAEDIAKSYIDLEKKLGEQSTEYGNTKKELENHKALTNVIAQDPILRAAVEKKINELSGKKEEDGEKKPDETKVAIQGLIINKFEEDRGLSGLSKEKREDLSKKMGTEIAEMLDPGGTKSPAEIIRSIPSDKLPMYLEKAYKLATIGDTEERARSQALLEDKQNRMASLGSIPSSGVSSGESELTPSERETARRMGVSEENYKKQKIAILKGE